MSDIEHIPAERDKDGIATSAARTIIDANSQADDAVVHELVWYHDGAGLTLEDVTEALLARLRELNAVLPCRENFQAITHFSQGLAWLEARSAERDTANVKGSMLPHAGPHRWYCTGCGAEVEFHTHGA